MRILLILCSLGVVTWGQSTIYDYLSSRRHSTFISLLQQTGLADTLKGAGPYTVFVPSEGSLRSLRGLSNDKLKTILQFHIANGIVKHTEFYNERLLDTLATGSRIRINHYYSIGYYAAEGVRIMQFDHVSSNGVVHMLKDAMTPPQGTVMDIINNNYTNKSIIIAAIKAAGLEHFLQDQSPITMFVPTVKAFADMGAGVAQALLTNPTLLKGILNYHIIPGSLYKEGYHPTSLHTYEEADKIRLHKFLFFGYEVDSGTITNEISATNGVVHFIDHVLIPGSLSAQVKALQASITTQAVPLTSPTQGVTATTDVTSDVTSAVTSAVTLP